MCAPRVTRHTSIRYSIFCHTRVNIGESIFFTASKIRAFRSARWRGNGTRYSAYFARNARCTVTTDLLVCYSSTQNDFSPGAAIFSLHALALPSGRNVNYDDKQLTGEKIFGLFLFSVRFRKYMSYGFPIIDFCIPGVHYAAPYVDFLPSAKAQI